MLKLKKPLYGLTESGDYLRRALDKHLVEDLGMSRCTLDAPVFNEHNSGSLLGVCATYVDDTLHAKTET